MSATIEERARRLFAPLGPTYDRYSRLLSLGQDPRWRAFLVSRLDVSSGNRVLDVATGTAAVAIAVAKRYGCEVVGLDQSPEMLERGRTRVAATGVADRVSLVAGSAEDLPFADSEFDALTFTYLLRYVDDPGATLRELARVVRPGGVAAALEFGIPRGVWRPLWNLYVDVVLPALGRAISPGWHEVGRFLGPSIREVYAPYPLERQLELWHEAGFEDIRARPFSLGGGVVTWARRA